MLFQVCWCPGDEAYCANATSWVWVVGQLSVLGPTYSEYECTFGVPCSVTVQGTGLRAGAILTVSPTPATHAISTQLKARETVFKTPDDTSWKQDNVNLST